MRSTGTHRLIVPGTLGEEVHCWAHDLDVGDKVGNIEGEENYCVALDGGGFIVVVKGVIEGWIEGVEAKVRGHSLPVFDVWGNRLAEDIDVDVYYNRKQAETEPLMADLMEEKDKKYSGYGRTLQN